MTLVKHCIPSSGAGEKLQRSTYPFTRRVKLSLHCRAQNGRHVYCRPDYCRRVAEEDTRMRGHSGPVRQNHLPFIAGRRHMRHLAARARRRARANRDALSGGPSERMGAERGRAGSRVWIRCRAPWSAGDHASVGRSNANAKLMPSVGRAASRRASDDNAISRGRARAWLRPHSTTPTSSLGSS